MTKAAALTHPDHLPVLDGIRFFAAFFVVICHYSHWVLADQQYFDQYSKGIESIAALGMAIFFVLSGFVIHYNYHESCTKPGGGKLFFIARFTRLYPLYIVLILMEFASSFRFVRTTCGYAGDVWGSFLSLPYYLTMTQDWFYGVICGKSLLMQYHMVSAVSWSVSLEVFFYNCYALFLARFMKRRIRLRWWLAIAVLAQLAVVLYFLGVWHFRDAIEHVAATAFGSGATVEAGYENSLRRWLLYFNPVMNLAAFFFGLVTAHLYMVVRRHKLSRFETRFGPLLTLLSIAALLGAHFYIYLDLGARDGFYGSTGSSMYAPLVAPVIFCLVRYSSLWRRVLETSLPVKLGQASYSIYLLHAFFGWNARDYYYLGLHPWLLWAIAVCGVMAIARVSYVCFERPAQRFLRKKMLKN
jgi:peptidoglycan/LPS O-acetylase OafA/YrhL